MATANARTTRLRSKATGRVYWVEYRTGFQGREFNYGGGWRSTAGAAFEAAEKSQALTEAPDPQAEALRQHLRTTGAHTRYLVAADLASMTLAQLTELHDDMPVTVPSCRDCPSKYR